MITIRKIAPEEIPFLKEMLYASLFVPEGAPPFEPSILETPTIAQYIANWGSLSNDVALVAVAEDNVLLGAIWGRFFLAIRPGYGFVDEQTPEIGMAVKSDFRNQGIGTQLIQELAQVYQTKGIAALSLSVHRQNKAKYLYEILGFEVLREEGDALVMVKKLL